MESKLFKDDWKHILLRAWSSRILMLLGVLTALDVAVPVLWKHGLLDLPPYVYPACIGILSGLALMARLMVQKDFR